MESVLSPLFGLTFYWKYMEDTVQFYHNQEEGVTYAANVDFSKEALLNLVHDHRSHLTVLFGISLVHPNDTYDKAIGRKLSKERLEPIELTLVKISFREDNAYVTLENVDAGLTFHFRTHLNSDKPHLLEIKDSTVNYF